MFGHISFYERVDIDELMDAAFHGKYDEEEDE
jgi:hypothetical protein